MFGEYAGYVVTAYVAVVLAVAALIAWVLIDARRLKQKLARMEAAGSRRDGELESRR